MKYNIHKINKRLISSTPRPIKNFLYAIWGFYTNKIYNSSINNSPIFILGNQRSGTTAIAILLAELANISIAPELKQQIRKPMYKDMYSGELSFEKFVRINKYDFSKSIIKDNNLIFFYGDIVKFFGSPKFIFIVRDPRENIRSILNRLNLPGDQNRLTREQVKKIPKTWMSVIYSDWLDIHSNNYIEQLAYRWNLIIEIYLNKKKNMLLVKYEDFNRNKQNKIYEICSKINLEPVSDISQNIDIQYQIAGDHSRELKEFFGKKNLCKIEKICKKGIDYFNYR